MNELISAKEHGVVNRTDREQVFVTIYIDKQLFGIPVERVRDILIPDVIAEVPLAPKEITGVINLRGRIVTVLDVRKRLGIAPLENSRRMCTTVEQGNELYSLMIDNIGSVLTLPIDRVEPVPTNMDSRWKSVSSGVVKLDGELMVVLDVDSLIDIQAKS